MERSTFIVDRHGRHRSTMKVDRSRRREVRSTMKVDRPITKIDDS